jgi:pyruvate carboxylase
MGSAPVPPKGTRNLLLELGPKGFAEWTLKQKRLLLTDTTFRDAHQSLLATRVRTYDMLACADALRASHVRPVLPRDVGGRHLRHRHAVPQRGPVGTASPAPRPHPQHLLPDAAPRLQRRRILQLPRQRGRRFRPTRRRLGHRYLPHLRFPQLPAQHPRGLEAVQGTHAIAEAAICYTGDILDPKRDKYPLQYYVKLAKEVERMGAHFLAIKDMAGLLPPLRRPHKLVKALREEIDLPIHLHTHDTSGINASSIRALPTPG